MLETIGEYALLGIIAIAVLGLLALCASAGKNHKKNRQHPWLEADAWVDAETGVDLIPAYAGFVNDEHGEPIARSRMPVRQPLEDLVTVVMNAPQPSRVYPNATPMAFIPDQATTSFTPPSPARTFVPVPLDGHR